MRDIVLSDAAFLENFKRLMEWSYRLKHSNPRHVYNSSVTAVTDAEPVDTSWATIDFSKDGAPSNAIGATVHWTTATGNNVAREWSHLNASSVSFVAGNTNGDNFSFDVYFASGTQDCDFRFASAPGAITTNAIRVVAWIV